MRLAETELLVTEDAGGRLDKYLAEKLGLPRAQVQRLIQEGHVSVGGLKAKASQRLVPGEIVKALVVPPSSPSLVPQNIPVTVVYQDEDLMVVDKPPGLTVHPAPGHSEGTLVNAILALCPALAVEEGDIRPGIVHRLDKDTSGLMVVAKNKGAHESLSRQIKERAVVKGYLALVKGRLEPREGLIDASVGRDPHRRQRMGVVEGGKAARTQYRVLRYLLLPEKLALREKKGQALSGCTLVEVSPETGRTHQIRVHFAAIGHPLVGDPAYGGRAPFLARQFLHAHRLGFRLPKDGRYVEFSSDLPQDLKEALALFQADN